MGDEVLTVTGVEGHIDGFGNLTVMRVVGDHSTYGPQVIALRNPPTLRPGDKFTFTWNGTRFGPV
jgi:hypothetical protein